MRSLEGSRTQFSNLPERNWLSSHGQGIAIHNTPQKSCYNTAQVVGTKVVTAGSTVDVTLKFSLKEEEKT